MLPALALEHIECTFSSRDDSSGRYTAVRDSRLRVGEGEFVSVVGPTGCGKTTLLNVAAGLLQPSAGAVTVFGTRLAGINSRAGYMFQSEALMPWRNAIENIIAGLEFRGMTRAQAFARGEEWLARVGPAGFRKRHPPPLSRGMRQRGSLSPMVPLHPHMLRTDEAS